MKQCKECGSNLRRSFVLENNEIKERSFCSTFCKLSFIDKERGKVNGLKRKEYDVLRRNLGFFKTGLISKKLWAMIRIGKNAERLKTNIPHLINKVNKGETHAAYE